ncbi:hypothetical protein L6452_07619 [Arctium lappa]|uniref:Uncharacterized protein n=1 Tax=Arctium lappa TaxID=4217 RepID=A0ACB9ELC7_ARCLA|nr:hypothetical protein L6452_07619 [Arctium lappa]
MNIFNKDDKTKKVETKNATFMEQAGDSVKNVAQGATDMAGGAANSVTGFAQGAATGATNLAGGAVDAVKNTFAPKDTSSK